MAPHTPQRSEAPRLSRGAPRPLTDSVTPGSSEPPLPRPGRRVVVTGMGTVNALTSGGKSAVAEALALGRSGIGPLRAFVPEPGTGGLAAEIDDARLAALVDPAEARRMSRICRLTVAACRLAVEDAGVASGLGLAIVVGSEHGDFRSSEEFAGGYLQRGLAGLSPMIFPNTVMNTMASVAAIAVGARAPSVTLNQPTIVGDLAVARAAAIVARGDAEAAVAGGVDEICAIVYRHLRGLGALSPMRGGGPEGCRPYAADHNGPVLGEGATFLVLESLDAARLRGASIVAELVDQAWGNVPAPAHAARPGRVDRNSPVGRLLAAHARRRVPARVRRRERRRRRGRLGARAAGARSRPARCRAAVPGAALRPARRPGRASRGRGGARRGARRLPRARPRNRARRLSDRADCRVPGATMSDHLIVIPVHNEAGTIGDVVRGAARHGDVLVVDDGSTDSSGEVAASSGADVIRLARRGGKGAALRRGLTEALARDAQRVVTMDGDGQHDPDDLPRLLAAAAQAPDALVIGGRLGVIGRRAAVPLPSGRVAAIRVAGFFINWLTGAAVSDTQSGLRVYPAGLIDAVRPRRGGFVLESEMLVGAATRGWHLVEVPVAAIHYSERRSRFRPVRDGTAVGTYLAARIAGRWCRETWLIARALLRPFTAARRRPRHRELGEFTVAHRHHPAAWAAAVGVFTVDRTLATWRDWLRDPRVRRMRVAAVATTATPALLALALATPALRRLGLDPIPAFVDRFYSQERLAGAEVEPSR